MDTNLEKGDEWETDWKPISLTPFAGIYFEKRYFRVRQKNGSLEVKGKVYSDVIDILEVRMSKFELQSGTAGSPIEKYYAKGIGLIYQYEPRFNWSVAHSLLDFDIK